MKLSTQNKIKSFTIVETLIAMIVSSLMIALIFNLLSLVRNKMHARQLYSSEITEKIFDRNKVLNSVRKHDYNNLDYDKQSGRLGTYETINFNLEDESTLTIQNKISEIDRYESKNK